MEPDPDHLRFVEQLHHRIQCHPTAGMPYERYGVKHRKGHRDFAVEFLNGLHNASLTLASTSINQEEHP